MYPHRKKSQGLRSGDLGGQSRRCSNLFERPCIYIYIYTYTHTHIGLYMCVCVCVCVCVHVKPITTELLYNINYCSFVGFYILFKTDLSWQVLCIFEAETSLYKSVRNVIFLYVLELGRNTSQKNEQFYICCCKTPYSLPHKYYNGHYIWLPTYSVLA